MSGKKHRTLSAAELETERRYLAVLGAFPADRAKSVGIGPSAYHIQVEAAFGVDWWEANTAGKPSKNIRGRHLNIDWSWYPLGTKSDGYFARKIGCSVRAVTKARAVRGLGPWQPRVPLPFIEWAAMPLGRISDLDVAVLAGCSQVTVWRRRTALGIPAYDRFAATHR